MKALLFAIILAAAPARADVVADWAIIADRGADGRAIAPPLQGQPERSAAALAALAMFEATNSLDPRYRSYLGLPRASGAGSAETAAATAAHGVLVHFFPERRAALDDALALSLSSIAPGAARDGGMAAGAGAAKAAIARTLFEGPETEPYRPDGAVGRYTPPELPLVPPWSMRAQFFFVRDATEVMPPPPPALTSAIYARDLNEVKRIGGIGQPGATPASLATARFLAAFNLDAMARRAAAAKPRLVDRARLWAMLRMAQFDANSMIGLAKMRYSTWRPMNAIRNADRDGNPETTRDPTWESVMRVPNHPEYPCGHCTMSSVMAGVMEPEVRGPIEVASEGSTLPVTLTFADWSAFRVAASLARIQGGMHFRFANEAGQAMGGRIAELARERFAPPLR